MELTQERLKSLLQYNSETGELRWRKCAKGRRTTLEAGTINTFGYRVITIDYQRYMAHCLIWFYHFGVWPSEIDHKNGIPADNRIDNLREVTHGHNLANAKTRADNKVGQRGICWDRQKQKWKVQLGPVGNRIQKHFLDLEDAKIFAQEMSVKIFGEFAYDSRA